MTTDGFIAVWCGTHIMILLVSEDHKVYTCQKYKLASVLKKNEESDELQFKNHVMHIWLLVKRYIHTSNGPASPLGYSCWNQWNYTEGKKRGGGRQSTWWIRPSNMSQDLSKWIQIGLNMETSRSTTKNIHTEQYINLGPWLAGKGIDTKGKGWKELVMYTLAK